MPPFVKGGEGMWSSHKGEPATSGRDDSDFFAIPDETRAALSWLIEDALRVPTAFRQTVLWGLCTELANGLAITYIKGVWQKHV